MELPTIDIEISLSIIYNHPVYQEIIKRIASVVRFYFNKDNDIVCKTVGTGQDIMLTTKSFVYFLP